MSRSSTHAGIAVAAVVERIGDRRVARLPAEASAQLPCRGQVAAEIVVGDRTVRTVVEPDGTRGHWIDADALGVDGVTLEARIEPLPTTAWPEPTIPDDLAAALADAEPASSTWASITPMARWEWVRWMRSTRSAETRARRVAVGIDKLAKGSRRPCCFDLSSCTDPELARRGRLVAAD